MKNDERDFFDRLLKFTDVKEILRHPFISSAVYKDIIKETPQNDGNYEETKESFKSKN